PNFLYRNNGNNNHWLKVKCVGIASNRSGLGAKVRLKATVRGTPMWQLREISGGSGFGQTSLLAHFGLGQATIADTVRVEWPSGAVQELKTVAADRMLIVTEPPKLERPKLNASGIELSMIGLPGSSYLIEGSGDLTNWI